MCFLSHTTTFPGAFSIQNKSTFQRCFLVVLKTNYSADVGSDNVSVSFKRAKLSFLGSAIKSHTTVVMLCQTGCLKNAKDNFFEEGKFYNRANSQKFPNTNPQEFCKY